MPFGAVLPVSVFVLEPIAGGDGERRDRDPAGRGLDLRVFADVAEKDTLLTLFAMVVSPVF